MKSASIAAAFLAVCDVAVGASYKVGYNCPFRSKPSNLCPMDCLSSSDETSSSIFCSTTRPLYGYATGQTSLTAVFSARKIQEMTLLIPRLTIPRHG